MRTRRTLAALLFAVTTISAAGCSSSTGNALVPMDGKTELTTASSARLGDIWNVGLPVTARDGSPVRIEAVSVLGLPDGMRLLGSSAYRYSQTAGAVGLLKGDLPIDRPDTYGHPSSVRDLELRPGKEEWYLVVSLKLAKAGTFHTKGLRVSYNVGQNRKHQDFDVLFTAAVR